MEAIRVKKLREGALLPTYGTAQAAGADLYACLEAPLTIAPGETAWVPTGLALEVPEGCAGLVYARSGLATKRGLAPAASAPRESKHRLTNFQLRNVKI